LTSSIQKYYILVSKGQIKLITSLGQKKFRDKEGLFIAEGPKIISELLGAGFRLYALFSVADFKNPSEKYHKVSNAELQKISSLKTANTSLAIFEIPKREKITGNGLILALDAIRDPGNLGTIIRLCDWFGIGSIICSDDTADCYNPKVVQASMGSIARVAVQYTDLSVFLKSSKRPVYGAVLDGTNIYTTPIPTDAIIVMGNESNGISEAIQTKLTHKITIPQFGTSQETESLNVATATAIILSEYSRPTEK
jgi:TrmH family RNA methyltransferase